MTANSEGSSAAPSSTGPDRPVQPQPHMFAFWDNYGVREQLVRRSTVALGYESYSKKLAGLPSATGISRNIITRGSEAHNELEV